MRRKTNSIQRLMGRSAIWNTIVLTMIAGFMLACSNNHAASPTPVIPTQSFSTAAPSPTATIPDLSPTVFSTIASPQPTIVPSPTGVLAQPSSLLLTLAPGQYIVYSAFDRFGQYDSQVYSLYVMSMDGSTQGKLMELPSSDAQLSSDGTLIAFLSSGELAIVDLRSNEKTEYSLGKTCQNKNISHLTWSPDSTNLALVCDDGDIYVWSLVAKQITSLDLLHNSPNNITDGLILPTWSPDGRWLAYYEDIGDPQNSFDGPFLTDMSCLSKPATCVGKTRVLGDLYGLIAWSPHNELSVVPVLVNEHGIDILNTNGAVVQKIPLPSRIDSFAWSPDYKWIATEYGSQISIVSLNDHSSRVLATIKKSEVQVAFWLSIP
jgi:WD40 repeat protein